MSESLLSPSWYRVAPLKPRLRSHVHIDQHEYRGQDWYVIQDRFTGRHHRFSSEAYQLVGMMDGRRTLAQIWEAACLRLGDHMPTQDEVIDLLSRLYRADLLQTSAFLDFSDLQQRRLQGRKSRLLTHMASPLSLRFPLVDPDRFLTLALPWVRPFLGWPALVLWMLIVTSAAVLAVLHWPDLRGDFSDALLSMENLLLVSLIYPVLKVLHEFGHAFMVKKEGGEVHEMGVMLLVFMPIPYVDASASTAFRDKHQRMLVGAAGIMIELFVAALMLFVWLGVETGAVRALAYNAMLVAGVSTLLFNGNPLLRFDAYYVLADYLEIPNLAQRGTSYLGYVFQRHVLGIHQAESPARAPGEARWLLLYALASFCYRMFISVRIVLFIAGKFFFVGIALALWSVFMLLVAPLWRMAVFLFKDVRMQRKRLRIVMTVFVPLCLLFVAVVAVPAPLYTTCEGVVWISEESRVHAAAHGFVTQVLVQSGSAVKVGTPLVESEDVALTSQVRLLEKRLEEFQARHQLSLQGDRTEAILMEEELRHIETELAHARELQEQLVVTSPAAGTFVMQDAGDMPGRFVRRGMPIGYVLDRSRLRVRVLVTQADVERVRTDTKGVEVRLAEDIGRVVSARVVREVPAASRVLPSLAFSLEGGGRFALDPREPDQAQVLERLFQFDLELAESVPANIEERVFVRFEHSPEPLAWRVFRALRRLLLSRFAV
jgi:putative peptide zinc metalloprotease protein